MSEKTAAERAAMVDEQLITRGITDSQTLKSMAEVPRHAFVPSELRSLAYHDTPLMIGEGQTISQPYIVALMTEAARCDKESVVLDVGTGSGYAAAIFSRIAKHVYSIERVEALAKGAEQVFNQLGYDNITVKVGDGTLGWKEKAPFDAIVVTAGAPAAPEALLSQLAPGGRLVIPVGGVHSQQLIRYRKGNEGVTQEFLELVRFVPLIGKEGWQEPSS